MPGLLLDQDLPSKSSLMLGQVSSIVIIVEKLVWFSSTMATKTFQVKMGDRIAQLILEKIDTPPVKEVQDLDRYCTWNWWIWEYWGEVWK